MKEDENDFYQKIVALSTLLFKSHEYFFIHQIIVQHISFSDEMLIGLGQLLNTPSTLRQLSLSYNALTENQALLLRKPFENNTDLTHIDISHNKIGKAASYFGDLLSTHHALKLLDIGDNQVKTNIIDAFSFGILHNTTLTYLGLSQCIRTELRAWQLFFQKLVANRTLTSLDISYNQIPSPTLLLILQLLIETGLNLHFLDLSGNSLQAREIQETLANLVRNTHSLRILKLNHCQNDLDYLSNVLPDNSTLHTLQVDIPKANSNWLDMEFDFDEDLEEERKRENKNTTAAYWSQESYHFWKKNPSPPPSPPTFRPPKKEALKHRMEKFYAQCPRTPTVFTFIQALYQNSSLRHIVLNVPDALDGISKNFFQYLNQHTALEKIELVEQGSESRQTKKINAKFRKTRNEILDQRKLFVHTLISLNYSKLWQLLPIDIKLLIFHEVYISNAFTFGKSLSQVLNCTRFIFSHAQACQELVKSHQKLVIIEKKEALEKYAFRFFTPPTEKIPVAIVAYKDRPLAVGLSKNLFKVLNCFAL